MGTLEFRPRRVLLAAWLGWAVLIVLPIGGVVAAICSTGVADPWIGFALGGVVLERTAMKK